MNLELFHRRRSKLGKWYKETVWLSGPNSFRIPRYIPVIKFYKIYLYILLIYPLLLSYLEYCTNHQLFVSKQQKFRQCVCLFLFLSESFKLNSQYMLEERDFIYNRYVYIFDSITFENLNKM